MTQNKNKHLKSPDFRLAMEFREKAKRQNDPISWRIAFDFLDKHRRMLKETEEVT
jgi:hypothetical protein